MRQCPLCRNLYERDADTCPADGANLGPDDEKLGLILGGRYQVEALIGRGGMGSVYAASQLNLDRKVAVKILNAGARASDTSIERFRREALAIARLRHPQIVVVHDFEPTSDVGAYLVLELLDGRSLRQELAARGRLPVVDTLRILKQICLGVDAAHANGVLHRDLKPENVFLVRGSDGDTVKVLDFGIARLMSDLDHDASGLTASGAFLGTPMYASPELCRGEVLDARSDVYALGCIAYEMMTGQPPFLARNAMALLHKHVTEAPAPPSERDADVPVDLERVVMRALAKLPEFRFRSAREFANALAAVVDALGIDQGFEPSTAAPSRGTAPANETFETGAAITIGRGYDSRDRLPPNNLPLPTTSFVGRTRDAANLAYELVNSRLLTLSGAGGMGKTRLALEIGWRVLPQYVGGVWFVELAAIADSTLVPGVVLRAVGARETCDRTPEAALVDHLKTSRSLVILDNCEHLVGSCGNLAAQLLLECAGVTLLATSREVLGLPGEVVRQLAPLTVSDGEGGMQCEAVSLFVERARLSNPRFELTSANARSVARLCRELEGIPLAIEIAAARTRALPVDQILVGVDDRFRLLTGSVHSTTPRQQALRTAIDWSYDLLDDAERSMLRYLSIFQGGCALEPLESIWERFTHDRGDAIEVLARLVDKSLLIAEEREDVVRYRLLDTIRQYALERLRDTGEEVALRTAHRDWP